MALTSVGPGEVQRALWPQPEHARDLVLLGSAREARGRGVRPAGRPILTLDPVGRGQVFSPNAARRRLQRWRQHIPSRALVLHVLYPLPHALPSRWPPRPSPCSPAVVGSVFARPAVVLAARKSKQNSFVPLPLHFASYTQFDRCAFRASPQRSNFGEKLEMLLIVTVTGKSRCVKGMRTYLAPFFCLAVPVHFLAR